MALSQPQGMKVEAVRRTKVETTYEYVPILGQILGFWRIAAVDRLGDDIELHIVTPLSEYDKLTINGKGIDIKEENLT